MKEHSAERTGVSRKHTEGIAEARDRSGRAGVGGEAEGSGEG